MESTSVILRPKAEGPHRERVHGCSCAYCGVLRFAQDDSDILRLLSSRRRCTSPDPDPDPDRDPAPLGGPRARPGDPRANDGAWHCGPHEAEPERVVWGS